MDSSKKDPIKNILVATESEMDMHRANSGENALGNVTSIKKRPDGRAYISGQMQRHALFEAMRELDKSEESKLSGGKETRVSPGSATSSDVETDLRADLGGFLQTSLDGDEARRTAPLSAAPAVAAEKSDTLKDLLLRFDLEGNEPDPVNMETSQSDLMRAAYSLDCTALSTTTHFDLGTLEDGDRGLCMDTHTVAHAPPEERLRRAKLFLRSTRFVNAHASQARNMTSLEPTRVFIALDTRISRKAARFFDMSSDQQDAVINEIEGRGGKTFIGDDNSEYAVADAYEIAEPHLDDRGIHQDEDWEVMGYREAYDD
ncbi:DevR family CRISPR-associated autoregulator [Salinibacter ruber]|jgi:CRISPR-associated protein Cst2|uniref:DevR family CRISPR-associated autoregulator n=1 Tax=Salinibacter ruber TaxID=146919 RepID=UPI0021670B20|nr:DevR family CRISPR-associated autoregulator [Salinibacter ruber]MCS4200681.1 CRISPR-associated protein Cst2 [Salinibacter ruber]